MPGGASFDMTYDVPHVFPSFVGGPLDEADEAMDPDLRNGCFWRALAPVRL
jgi:hypothetical protein